ncbi:MAG: ribonuclease HI [Bdellovibrionales bacterium]|nr:ribonuclease HI [Bdellovibrionales bacterium]NQZ18298.1 ribonuclease HI [Bdellovibrionales bacterium]
MDDQFTDKILIFTDGACSGNPGPGGFGVVIVYPEGEIEEMGGSDPETTNNRMEMLATILALKKVADREEDVWVLTDSTYVIRGITQWIWGWKKKGWKTASGNEVTNIDLWKSLDQVVAGRKQKSKLDWKYLRGHSGTPGNERCDEIAVAFSKKKFIELYKGSLIEYPIAIHDLPEDLSLPPMKSSSGKKAAAHSYLSYVNGQLQRHQTWKECEAVVKGRPGAKFKKSTSAANEQEIVKGWGLDPKKLPS